MGHCIRETSRDRNGRSLVDESRNAKNASPNPRFGFLYVHFVLKMRTVPCFEPDGLVAPTTTVNWCRSSEVCGWSVSFGNYIRYYTGYGLTRTTAPRLALRLLQVPPPAWWNPRTGQHCSGDILRGVGDEVRHRLRDRASTSALRLRFLRLHDSSFFFRLPGIHSLIR